MIITPIHTEIIRVGEYTIDQFLAKFVQNVSENQIVVITSKVVSICEGNVVSKNETDIDTLISKEADYFLPRSLNPYGYGLSIKNNTLVANAGVDESNADGDYILWPKDPQASANHIHAQIKNRFQLKNVGVLITDSHVLPLRWGTMGTVIGYSGFHPLNSYVGKPDLFGRPFKVARAGVAEAIAAAAVIVMGEGDECTPVAIVSDIPFVSFQDDDPTPEDLKQLSISKEEDVFGPLLNSVPWETKK